jgi:uncharacterized protein DUF4154
MNRARRMSCVSLLMLATLLAGIQAHAALFSADAVKAAFLYRFASYIEWPEDVPEASSFVIAVFGAEDVAKQLDELLPKMTVHGRPALVRRVTRASELEGVHILYVGPKEPLARSRSVREAAILLPILLVTDDERGLDAGGVINFIEQSRNVRFEVSLAAADRARLKIASALLSVAARVERRPQAWSSCADPYPRRYRESACVVRVAMTEARAVQ